MIRRCGWKRHRDVSIGSFRTTNASSVDGTRPVCSIVLLSRRKLLRDRVAAATRPAKNALMRPHAVLAALAAASMAASACGGRTVRQDDGVQGDASSLEEGGVDAGELPLLATISLANEVNFPVPAGQQPIGPEMGVFGAWFNIAPVPPGPFDACSAQRVYGSCVVSPPPCSDAGTSSSSVEYASAGVLTLNGISTGSTTVPPYDDPSYGYDYAVPGSLFSAGAAITVSASGSVVPPFTSPRVTGPATVTLTAPRPASGSDGTTFPIPPGVDLALAWTGGEPGAQVGISFEGIDANGAAVYGPGLLQSGVFHHVHVRAPGAERVDGVLRAL